METGFGVNAGFERYRNSEQVISDGATSNRAQIQGPFDSTNNPRGWVAGAATLTWRGVVTVPSSNPAVILCIAGAGSVNTADLITTYAGTLSINLVTSGKLNIRQTAPGSSYRQFETNASFVSAYPGQAITLEIIWTQGTASPVARVNEVDISASFTATTTGTPPAWLDAAMVPTYHLTGYNWPSGPAPVGCWILGSLTDADRAFHRSTGKYPAWVVAGGSYNAPRGVFQTGLGGTLTTFTGVTDSGFTATKTGGGNGFAYAAISSPLGTTVRVRFTATLTSGAVPTVYVNTAGVGNASNIATVVSGANDWTLTPTVGGNDVLSFSTSGDTSYAISGLIITRAGALSLPGIQPCNVVDDLTTIGGNSALLVGMNTRSSSNKKVWRISDLTKTSGNEQLLGGPVFYGTSEDLITKWTIVNAGGTTTVSLGNVSGGTQYANAVSCPTGTTVITLLTAVPLTTNLWCNANTTASLTHIIEGKRTV